MTSDLLIGHFLKSMGKYRSKSIVNQCYAYSNNNIQSYNNNMFKAIFDCLFEVKVETTKVKYNIKEQL